MSYSQHGEEVAILQHFAGRTGRLLDIGAFDGRAFSNTLALIDAGWSAVLVEPSARAFDKLMEQHSGNSRVRLVQALIVPEDTLPCGPNLRRFHQCGDALSTTEQGNLDTWSRVPFVQTWVPALPLSDLLQGCGGAFDFVNVDTEGTSVPLFHALMRHASPEVVCVEHDGLQVSATGYSRIYFDGNNVILKRTRTR